MAKNIELFEKVCEWLRNEGIAKIPRHSIGSYQLKHLAEQAVGEYVSNGLMIVAAIHEGLAIKRIKGSLNVSIACRKNELDINKIAELLNESFNTSSKDFDEGFDAGFRAGAASLLAKNVADV